MNTRPIETALDRDLRLSGQALRRAAMRAREIAVSTGTDIVISRDGAVLWLDPIASSETAREASRLQEPANPYSGMR